MVRGDREMEKQELVGKMKSVFGTVYGLYANTHAAHWNCEGIDFRQLHLMFEEQYQDIWESLDGIAEQIRQLDAYAPQGLARVEELNACPDIPSPPYDYKAVLNALQDGNEKVMEMMEEANTGAQALHLSGLSNFLEGRIEQHSKWRWFLRVSAK